MEYHSDTSRGPCASAELRRAAGPLDARSTCQRLRVTWGSGRAARCRRARAGVSLAARPGLSQPAALRTADAALAEPPAASVRARVFGEDKAAASVSAQELYAKGVRHLTGQGVPRDPGQAAALLRKAALLGDPRAQNNLGSMYAQGIGVKRDDVEACRWYELAAGQGNPDGQYNLAVFCSQGLGGCARDLAKAHALCEEAAAGGHEKARLIVQHSRPTPAKVSTVRVMAAPEAATSRSEGPAPPDTRQTAPAGLKEVRFAPRGCVELRGPAGGRWEGREAEARFPKPGTEEHFRRIFLLESLATEEEISGILQIARTALEYEVDKDSVDLRPTYEHYVVEEGRYTHEGLKTILRPLIEDRLLPYVRQKYNAPEAIVSTSLIRRYLPDERRVHPTHRDGHSFCTALLGLNAGEFTGGLYVQPRPDIKAREFVSLGRGDLAVHQYDLPHGVRVFGGSRYSIVFWVKDSMESCVAKTTPWYHSAVAMGDADAMTALAQQLDRGGSSMSGEGDGRDRERAARLYRRAAELGQAEAQKRLGLLYEAGLGGLPADGTQAMHWWRVAAEGGDGSAQRLLALAYSNGTCGLRRNSEEALRWMTRAAEQEDWDAMSWLGMYYSGGLGTPQDATQAMGWLKRLAEMGNAEAQYAVGQAYLDESTGGPSREYAALWLRRAAANGSGRARDDLKALGDPSVGFSRPGGASTAP